MKTIVKTTLMITLALIMLGCGEDDMAHIGEEVVSELNTTNVTDDTQVYNETAENTVEAHMSGSSFIIISDVLWGTGENSQGQLGLGDNIDVNSFTSTGIADVRSVHSGEWHTFLIKNNGSLWATGSNPYGGLGLGDEVDKNVFTDTGITDVRSVSCGTYFTSIVKTDGSIWSTGRNDKGQLGLGDNINVNVFTNTGVTDIKHLTSGEKFSLVIKTDGTLWATGNNNYGQFGSADNIDVNVFTSTGVTDVKYFASGHFHSQIIKNNNTLWATGRNNIGQLGLGDEVDKNVFTDTGITDVRSVSCGTGFTSIVKTDDTILATGENTQGQLGLGDYTKRSSFTDTGLSSVEMVSCGTNHAIITKTNDTLWATGWNSRGQLGLGDNTNRNIFTDTSQSPDVFITETWTAFYPNDIVKIDDYRYSISLLGDVIPSIYVNLTQIGVVNQLKPFDNQNITPAIFASPMTYKITGEEEFNAFTLAKVLATSVTYTFRLSDTTLIKTETIDIDVSRDKDGILSDYPTTVVFYADQQMPIGSTVEISLTYSDDIELGDFTLNNMIDSGFTNLSFSHAIKDFNDYTPDAWGNIPESVKAIVTTFQVSMDVPLTNYDYAVSFNESIAGKNVTIDASDSNGLAPNGTTIFGSLIRRVRITNPAMKSEIKDGDLGKMATLTMKAQEIA